ncbi:glycolate oxidase subunit GlcF [Methylorubrum extorquens]|uniref:Glycolate oxidase iron-sulfur subunit n=1 Tax=Methylorubrum extorquens TaxID=408 RepID=A0AAX3WQ24_METEX|nr:glycolate oxidase subunit GlcF [Methylorubrum extorquens]WHQ72919.1 glycolate oxidase subunit GlcF [Methylorubrum extorquens]
MQTDFSLAQLADPAVAASERIIRRCVHCGFCTATCPTYLLDGDELDSPRGRIYLIKNMLESGAPATETEVRHVDRCLSCLSCMSTCPSGVDYMHLVDHARAHIEKTYRRPPMERLLRAALAAVLPYPGRFRLALLGARLARDVLGRAVRRLPQGERIDAMLALAPQRSARRAAPLPSVRSGTSGARVAILGGCAQRVLRPAINEAAERLLARLGVEVVPIPDEGCCGALVHHMGREDDARGFARRNIDAWIAEIDGKGLDAILITASGCGTTVKDYGHMLADDPDYRDKAARVSALALDISQYLARLTLGRVQAPSGIAVAYHSACSLQHGQRVGAEPRTLLKDAGFIVKDPPEGHICCGSAGVYNIMQPATAGRLLARKVANIDRVAPDVIATGNIGCITQIASGTRIPVLHTVELLDWAWGGPIPEALAEMRSGSQE